MTARPLRPRPTAERAQKLARLGRVPKEVYDLLAEAERPLKAYELLWRLQTKRGAVAPPSTIYRGVEVLIENGLAHKVQGLSAFVVCRGADAEHDPVFLVCEKCGHAHEAQLRGLTTEVKRRIEGHGFRLSRLSVSAHGVCSGCNARSPASTTE